MAAKSLDQPPLIMIVGETASGKTVVGIDIAKAIGGEIICADSRTVYRYMDIGTAKPTRLEQTEIPHHILDIRNPDESFSVAEFKQLAQKCIQEISQRSRIPIVVGGTGLYVDALLYNFQFTDGADNFRQKLNTMSDEELTTFIINNKIDVANVNTKNKRHLIGFIARGGVTPENIEPRPNTLILGLRLDREVLKSRIIQRVDLMFRSGFLDEANFIVKTYGWNNQAMSGIGYRTVREFFEGSTTLEEVKRAFVRRDLSLAKRQRTWFKRNKNIRWFDDPRDLYREAIRFSSR